MEWSRDLDFRFAASCLRSRLKTKGGDEASLVCVTAFKGVRPSVLISFLPAALRSWKILAKWLKFWRQIQILYGGLSVWKLSEYCSSYHFWNQENIKILNLSDWLGSKEVWTTLLNMLFSPTLPAKTNLEVILSIENANQCQY